MSDKSEKILVWGEAVAILIVLGLVGGWSYFKEGVGGWPTFGFCRHHNN